MKRLTLSSLSLVLVACGLPGGPPKKACELTVWHRPVSDAADVRVVGSWDDWAEPGVELPGRPDGWRAVTLPVPPGPQAYAIIEDGRWHLDATIGTTTYWNGREVTWAEAPDCGVPELKVDAAHATAGGEITIEATFHSASDGVPVLATSVTAVNRRGAGAPPLDVVDVDASNGRLVFKGSGFPKGKHTFILRARDVQGRQALEARASAWVEDEALAPSEWTVYQVVVDRFRGKEGAVLAPPSSQTLHAGGHLSGVLASLESGELEALGVTAIWLSPLYLNPPGQFMNFGRVTTGYHGYWPTASRRLDPRFGTEEELDALIEAAHARGVRVIFDVVPNHIHADHPYWAQRRDDSWFVNAKGDCLCGVSCSWTTRLEDCWFTPFLPDLDWRNPEVAEALSDDVAWWIERFDADGLRIDAVPMMPRSATRRIAHEVRRRFEHPGHELMLMGEVYTGVEGLGSMAYYLGPAGLDGVFHFPLLWRLRETIADARLPMSVLDEVLRQGEEAWAGSGAVMGMTIGNHDTPRFATVAAGQAGGPPEASVPQPTDPLVYRKQSIALVAAYTLQGVPIIYYGDEVGLAGRGDPDSRRVMPAEAALTSEMRAVRDIARRVGQARRCSRVLREGTYRLLMATPEVWAYARELPGEAPVVVVLQRNTSGTLSLALPGIPSGEYLDVVASKLTSIKTSLTSIQTERFSAQLYIPTSSQCGVHRE